MSAKKKDFLESATNIKGERILNEDAYRLFKDGKEIKVSRQELYGVKNASDLLDRLEKKFNELEGGE